MLEAVPNEAAIRALASRASFERGRDYWQRGAVAALVRRGEELTTEVEGSEGALYRVSLRLDRGGVAAARCTCPYDWGGVCKHVVAALLKLAADPAGVTERPPLRELLLALDRDRLVELIVDRGGVDPGLAGWIEAELATGFRQQEGMPVDTAPLAAHARTVLAGRYRRRDYWDDYDAAGDPAELRELVAKAVPFLEAGDGRNALRLLEAVTEPFVDDWIDYASGSDEHMYELFADLGRMMAEAALMSDLDAAEREDLAATLADWQSRLDEYGVEGFEVAIRAVEAGWHGAALQAVLAGEAEATDDVEDDELTTVRLRVLEACGRTDAYLNLARAAGARTSLAVMLVKLDRVVEAVAFAQDSFGSPGEALDLARALRDRGRHDEALAVAEAGLRLAGGPAVRLARWLRDYAGPLGRRELALSAARAAFAASLSLEDYRAAASWAGAGWAVVRGDLLAHLAAARDAPDRTEILLSENLVDEAVRSVGDRLGPSDDVLMRLAEAAHGSHPEWVIRLAEGKAAQIIEAGAAGSYDVAAQWLERAALAYESAGRLDDWATMIEALIERHRRKYKLRPLLDALR